MIAVAVGLVALLILLGRLPGAVSFPDADDVTKFLDGFWPQFVATLVAVAGGIPAGLYIERRIERGRRAIDQTENDRRRRELVTLLLDAVEINREAVQTIDQALSEPGQTPVAPTFDTATWGVRRDDAIALFEPQLRVHIARYFGYLAELRDLAHLHREYTIGLSSALDNADAVSERLRSVIRMMIDFDGLMVDPLSTMLTAARGHETAS